MLGHRRISTPGQQHKRRSAGNTNGVQVEAPNNNGESPKPPSFWARIWNEQDVRIMVLISLALQLFLLFAGNVRRRRRVGWLKFLVWLAYLAAYAVVASAIGLFSQYEGKYKLRSLETSEDLHTLTMPFLWAPFLLLHLGGPDTITAFSIEDNNLWTRQLLNLVVQLSLALYVFWKSHDLLDSRLVHVAIPLFLAGIIKYGERIWAFKRGSRNDLNGHYKQDDGSREYDEDHRLPPAPRVDAVEFHARSSALLCRGMLVGRKLVQLGNTATIDVQDYFTANAGTEVKLKFVLTEIGMIYDMLYTKVMVLRSWTGVFRYFALVSMVVAFVLFWANEHQYAHRTTNAAITYTLFVAAIFVEVYSIFMVIASPWTRGYWQSRESTNLFWLFNKLAHCFPSLGLPRLSIGQFNLPDYSLSSNCITVVSQALGLKHWRNIWHVKHVEDEKIVNYIVRLFNFEPASSGERSRQLELGEELTYLLTIPFEHALFNLHIFTEIHLSTLDNDASPEMKVLAAQCRKLSNYLMYLMAVYPSMLPVSSATEDIFSFFTKWVMKHYHGETKPEILKLYAHQELIRKNEDGSPFKGHASEESLKEMKEVWARLIIYAAGKCPMELHARQLGEGLELLTVVGLLLIHCNIGDAGLRDLDLLAPPPRGSTLEEWPIPEKHKYVVVHRRDLMSIVNKGDPLYAFEFSQQTTSLQQPSLVQKSTTVAYQMGSSVAYKRYATVITPLL